MKNGVQLAETEATEPAEGPKLKRIAAIFTNEERATIGQAVTLKLACDGPPGANGPSEQGEALADLVGEWLRAKRIWLREQAKAGE
jgi:hypothetical protein